MKNINILILSLVFLMGESKAYAALIKVKVVFGEKTSEFKLSKTSAGGNLDFSDNNGVKKSRKLSSKELIDLASQVSNLRGISNQLEFCNRTFIKLSHGKKDVYGCLGAQNQMATDLERFSNLLSLII